MNPAFKLILFFTCVLAAREVAAEQWRGIKPLTSTRADVVRLLGQCGGEKNWCEFTLDNEEILIEFSSVQSCLKVASDTVLSIQRELRTAMPIEALFNDKRRFKSFDPAIPRNLGYRGFIDEKAGLLFKTFRGEVFQINYIAPKNDWQVCPDYYRTPRAFVAVRWPHVFTVTSVRCPQTSPIAGDKVVIRADYARSGQRFTRLWQTTEGRIVEGQNTPEIVLDTTGLEGKIITVIFELSDSTFHTATGACSFTVSQKTKN
jgi:hypothetical protein